MDEHAVGLFIDYLYTKLVKVIQHEGNSIRTDIKQEIQLENNKILEIFEQQTKKLNHLEEKYNNLESNYLNLQRQIRKNNIVIFGLQVRSGENLLEFTLNKLKEFFGINILESDINNIYQIKANAGTPIKVDFVSYLKKSLIFQNIYKLKGKKIFIAHDLCPEDRKNRKILQEHFKLAMSINQFAQIKGNKLTVNEDVFTANQLRMMNLDEHKPIGEDSPNTCVNFKSNSAPPNPIPNVLNQSFENNESSGKPEHLMLTHESEILSPSLPPTKKNKTGSVLVRKGSTSTNYNSPRATRLGNRQKTHHM